MNESATLHHLYMNTQNHITAPSPLGLSVREGKVVVSSRDVAEKFGKKHFHVLRDIENLECSKDFTESNFGCSEYTDPTGRKLPEVLMTRDGFTFLAMGFTGAKASQFKEAYIAEFNRMESLLMSPVNESTEHLLSRALLIADDKMKQQATQIAMLEDQALQDAPYTHFGKCVEVSDGCVLLGEFAKILAQNGMRIGQNRLFKHLRHEGILGKMGHRYNVPAQEFVEAGYFRLGYRIIQHSNGSKESKATPYLTPRGQIWMMKRMGIKPGKEIA